MAKTEEIMESGRKLCEAIKNAYTFISRHTEYPFRYTGETCTYDFDPDDQTIMIISLVVRVDEVQYEYTGELQRNSITGDYFPTVKSYDEFKVLSSEKHELEFTIDTGNFNVIDNGGKRRTTINYAKNYDAVKFFNNQIRILCYNPKNDNFEASIYIELMLEKDKTGEYIPSQGKISFFKVNENFTDEEQGLEITLSSLLDYYGMLGKYSRYFSVPEVKLDDKTGERIKVFRINQKSLDKLKIISKGEFDESKSGYLTSYLLDYLLSQYFVDIDKHQRFEQRECDKFNVKTPLDYRFSTGMEGLINVIQESTYNLQGQIRSYYQRQVKKSRNAKDIAKIASRKLSAAYVQNAINGYFHSMQESDFHEVQTSKDTNTVTLLTQANTIYFYEKDRESGKYEKTRTYSKYFTGVLDPMRTKEGPSINKSNEFADGVAFRNGQIEITVIEIATGKDVKLSYTDFNLLPILADDCYDEKNHSPKMHNGVYTILQYSSYETIDSEKELYKRYPNLRYTRKPDNVLSTTTKLIPFVDHMLSNRTALGSHFIDQAVPLAQAKPPAVYTGAGSEIYENNPDNRSYDLDESGTVIDVRDQYVKVRTKSGKEKIYGPEKQFNTSSYKTTSLYKPVVKIGQRVKNGDILVTSNSFINGEFTTFVPVYVAYGTYLGHEHEDAIILTRKAAEKFAHLTYWEHTWAKRENGFYSFIRNDKPEPESVTAKRKLKQVRDPVTKKTKIVEAVSYTDQEKNDIRDRTYNLDEWSLVKKGSIVRAGSILFEYYEYDYNSIKNGYGDTLGNQIYENSRYRTRKQIRVPYHVRNPGTVEKVALIVNGEEKHFDRGLVFDEEELEKMTKTQDLDRITKETKRKFPGTFGLNAEDNKEAYEHFRKSMLDEYTDNLKFQNKTKRRGSIVYKLDDDTNSFELHITISYLDEITDERLGAKLSNLYGSKGVCSYLIPDEHIPKDEFGNEIECIISTNTTYSRQNTGQINECRLGLIALETAKYIRNKTPTNPKVRRMLDKLYPDGWDWAELQHDIEKYGYCRIKVKSRNEDYYTEKFINDFIENELDLGDGKSRLLLPEFGENFWTYGKCTVGLISLMRLHFIQEHKIGLTGEMSEDEDSDNLTYPYLEREGGQKIGQMELAASLTNGLNEILEDCAKNNETVSKGSQIGSMALMIGLKFEQ